jgi:hypothetical protein
MQQQILNQEFLNNCYSGNIYQVKKIIGLLDNFQLDLNLALFHTCTANNINTIINNIIIIKLLIIYGANDINKGLEGACIGGNAEIVHLMLQNGATNSYDAIKIAFENGHFHICNILQSYHKREIICHL